MNPHTIPILNVVCILDVGCSFHEIGTLNSTDQYYVWRSVPLPIGEIGKCSHPPRTNCKWLEYSYFEFVVYLPRAKSTSICHTSQVVRCLPLGKQDNHF